MVAAIRAGHAGAVPGVPVLDTIKRVENGVVATTLDRDELVAVQRRRPSAPMLCAPDATGDGATDDAALLRDSGLCRARRGRGALESEADRRRRSRPLRASRRRGIGT